MLDDEEVRTLAAHCGIRIVAGSLDGDLAALLWFAAALDRHVREDVMDELQRAG